MKLKRKLRKPLLFALIVIVGLILSAIGTAGVNYAQQIDATQMIVDGEVWFTVADGTALSRTLDTYKQSFIRNVDSRAVLTSVDFEQNIELKPVRVNKDAVISIQAAELRIRAIAAPATIYTVVKGDNLWNIAKKNNIPLSEIIRLNPDLNPDKIWPGNQIVFVPEDPVLDVVVRLENKAFESIEYATEYVRDPALLATQRIVLKEGKEGKKMVTYDITMRNGYAEDVVITQETELVAPVKATVKVGTKRTLTRISNSNFGVVSGRLSSGFGYRVHPITGRKTFHAGIDIAAPTGTAVYNYAAGKVVEAGWDNYYGKHVIVSHGGGLQTVYMHLSSINVSVGDKIETGKRIGNVGNTGFSTGSHLHFEVRLNGVAKSPWNYI